jgi:hypothetical protein
MGWTGELWSNCVVLKFKTKGIALFCFFVFFLVFLKKSFLFLIFQDFLRILDLSSFSKVSLILFFMDFLVVLGIFLYSILFL